ncbi:MAG: VCBS repeat-containing protein, partial [Bacteroidales bacterium]|nr:VCBS repeat-containing protein [Bacteroidales bacterium]
MFEIDESLIYGTDYQTYLNPTTRNLNEDLPVGSTLGSFQVTPNGGANYSIPIQVAPGTAGIQPNISISYNSHGGDGLLGKSWSLSGISAITRGGKSLYYDGTSTSVSLTSSDRFWIDGQRIVEGGPITYGRIDQVHYTEVYDYSTITPKGNAGYGPAYFFVEKRDGTKIYYGNYGGSNAYLKSPDNATIITWYIARIEDRRGNYIAYNYERDDTNGETWLTSIHYTGNDSMGIDPYNTIEFYYQDRTDYSDKYVAGCKITNKKILRKIRTLCEGQLVRSYVPKYYFNDYTRLNEIEEYNAAGERYNSTVVGWGAKVTSNTSFTGPYTPEDNEKELYFGFADFNGDGLTDFLKCRKTDETTQRNFEWEVWIAQYNSFVRTDTGTWEFTDAVGFQFIPGDFNGDEFNDLVVCVDLDGGNNSQVYCFESLGTTLSCDENDYFLAGDAYQFYPADLDLDGITELINIHSSSVSTYKFNSSDLSIPPTEVSIGLNLGDNMKSLSYFDGDSKPDIFSVSESDIKVYELSLSGYSQIFSSTQINSHNATRLYTGDFNGDRNVDILTWHGDEDWNLFYNTGIELLASTAPSLPNIDMEATPVDNNIFLHDFNADGKTDIVYAYRNVNNSNLDYYYSNGFDGFTSQSVTDIPGHVYVNKHYIRAFTDFNGDGHQDIFSKTPGDGTVVAYLNRPNDKSRFVNKLLNGFNNLTTINYTSIADPLNTVYTKGTGAIFPISDFKGAMYVVSSVTQTAGSETLADNSYTYESAKIHRMGKGFLGFGKFFGTNNLTGIVTTSSTNLKIINDKYYYPYISYVSTKLGVNTLTAHNKSLALEEYPYAKRFRPYITQTIETNYLEDIKITTKYNEFDDYGNPTNITDEYKADDISTIGNGTVEELITKTIQYWPETNSYLPSTINITSNRDGQPEITTSKTISYTSDHLPDIIKINPGKSVEIWEDNDYDGCGNLIQKRLTDNQSTELQKISYTYDSKKRFAIEATNALGHTNEYTYDPRTGNTLSTTNAQGVTTTNLFDNFGRLEAASSPVSSTSIDLKWSDDPYINGDLYRITTLSDDGSYKKEYFDAFGRKVHERAPSMGLEEVKTTINYNSKGLVESQSEPYEGTSVDHYIYYSHDDYGRLTDVESYRQDISYSYPEPRKTVVTNNLAASHSSWTKTNSLGEVIQAQDQGGDLYYTYNAVGLPVEIEAPGGIITEMTYDLAGNQTSLTDPSLGTTTYEYDLLGNLTKQTDQNGEVYDLSYDAIGRLTSKTNTTEGTTTYTYVTSGNGLGLLQSISNNNTNISKTYAYDEYSRLISQTENIESTDYIYSYEYDILGRIQEMTYPGGDFSINYKYNTHGMLMGVNDENDNNIWEIEDINQLGAITDIQYGNGLTTQYSYDPYNQLNEIITTNASAQKKQHLQYSFAYQTGNLTSRSDMLANSGSGITESFQYDELDRLTDYTVGSNAYAISYNLDGTGRYNSKSDLGSYQYGENGAPEYALTSITGSDGSVINRAQQDIYWTSFNKVEQIVQGTLSMDFVYGPNHERKVTELYNGTTRLMKKTFVGNYYEIEEDEEENIRRLYYVPG